MADLTDTLPTIQNAKGISSTSAGGSSGFSDALSGITGLGKSIFSIAQKSNDEAWQTEVRDHTRTEWAQQQGDRDATNAAASGLFDIEKNLDNPDTVATPNNVVPDNMGGPPPVDSSLAGSPDYNPPSDVQAGADSINAAQKAVNQGRGSQSQVDIQTSQLVDDLRAKYPDSQAAIAAYMASRGIDHTVYRTVLNQQAVEQNEFQSQQQTNTQYVDAATKAGRIFPGMSFQDQVAAGRQVTAEAFAQKQAKELADEARAQGDYQMKVDDKAQSNASNAAVNAALIKVNGIVDPVVTRLQNIVTAAGPDVQQQLSNMTPQIGAAFATVKNNVQSQMIANGAKPEDVKRATDLIDQKRDAMLAYFDPSNSASFLAAQNRQLQTFSNTFGIQAAQALPKFMAVQKALGPQGMALMFSSDPSMGLPPQQLQNIKAEFQGWDIGSEDGIIHLNNIVNGLRGNLKLQQVPQGQQETFIRGQIAGVHGASQAINTGARSPDMESSLYNGYDNVLNAAGSLRPGASLNALQVAANVVTDGGVRQAISSTRDNALHDSTVQGGRAAAANILETTKLSGPSDTKYQHLFFNSRTGQVDISFNRQQWLKDHPGSGSNTLVIGGGFGSGAGLAGNPGPNVDQAAQADPTLAQKRDIMNKTINHLVTTMGDDKNLIPGMSPKQYAQALFNGQQTDKAPAAPGPNGKQEIQDQVTQLQRDLQNITIGGSSGPGSAVDADTRAALKAQVPAIAQSYGVKPALVDGVISKESSYDPNADAHVHFPNSHAYGLGQIQPGTATLLGYTPEDRKDPVKNIQMTSKYLSHLITSHGGDVKAALREYSGNSYSEADLNRLSALG